MTMTDRQTEIRSPWSPDGVKKEYRHSSPSFKAQTLFSPNCTINVNWGHLNRIKVKMWNCKMLKLSCFVKNVSYFIKVLLISKQVWHTSQNLSTTLSVIRWSEIMYETIMLTKNHNQSTSTSSSKVPLIALIAGLVIGVIILCSCLGCFYRRRYYRRREMTGF